MKGQKGQSEMARRAISGSPPVKWPFGPFRISERHSDASIYKYGSPGASIVIFPNEYLHIDRGVDKWKTFLGGARPPAP